MEMPRSRKQASVEAQSAAVEKFEISETPSASAAISAARCEIDLSPGNRRQPSTRRTGFSRIMSANVLTATEQATLCYKLGHPAIAIPPQRVSPNTIYTRGRAIRPAGKKLCLQYFIRPYSLPKILLTPALCSSEP